MISTEPSPLILEDDACVPVFNAVWQCVHTIAQVFGYPRVCFFLFLDLKTRSQLPHNIVVHYLKQIIPPVTHGFKTSLYRLCLPLGNLNIHLT